MTCIHNGTKVRYSFDGSHVYAGDTYECKSCGHKIVATNRTPYQDKNVILQDTDVIMDPIETEVIRPKNINLRDRYVEESENKKVMNWLEKEQEKTINKLNNIGIRTYSTGPR
jgi:DNA-directed RNA polymerase subunit RPC12/RpoP